MMVVLVLMQDLRWLYLYVNKIFSLFNTPYSISSYSFYFFTFNNSCLSDSIFNSYSLTIPRYLFYKCSFSRSKFPTANSSYLFLSLILLHSDSCLLSTSPTYCLKCLTSSSFSNSLLSHFLLSFCWFLCLSI